MAEESNDSRTHPVPTSNNGLTRATISVLGGEHGNITTGVVNRLHSRDLNSGTPLIVNAIYLETMASIGYTGRLTWLEAVFPNQRPVSMASRVGPLAMIRYEPRQARKGATVVADSCAGVWLSRLATLMNAQNDSPVIVEPMVYQALARKWRPRNFDQIVGQEHVVKALTHALLSGRMHHAYLFTGTRGVGKTTLARILAKAINCDNLQGFNPCGECLICREVDEGRCVDLLEVDAASRTRVEDTRDLLENVQYAPNQGRYKVYLIDEVHMLSGHSFNALLKTLEEPPPHVKFLLATTDPQKIPVTVLSRCLQFNLKHLTAEQIRHQMSMILTAEHINFEQNALHALARTADGSMRDGLSLLDQAIAHGGGSLDETSVSLMLGTVARTHVFDLLNALADGDAAALLARIANLAAMTPNYMDVLQNLLTVLHHTALAQWAPDTIHQDDDANEILSLSKRISAEDLQLYYQIALIGQRDLPLAHNPRGGFEMIMLRMLAFRPAAHAQIKNTALQPASPKPAPAAGIAIGSGKPTAPATSTAHAVRETAAPAMSATAASPASQPTLAAAVAFDDWAHTIQAMELSGLTQQLARNCTLKSLNENQMTLALDPGFAHCRTPALEAQLERKLGSYYQRTIKLQILVEAPKQDTPATQIANHQKARQQNAEQSIEEDGNVRQLIDLMNARIIPGSTKPIA
jgi:DNA polymerase III subunit gamma/tau